MDLWNDSPPAMTFAGVCLITEDVLRLRAFYEQLFAIQGEGDDEHVDLRPAGAGLTIFTPRGMEQLAPGSMTDFTPGPGNALLAIYVDGSPGVIDAIHERLLALQIPIVKPPQTHPWGARSTWCRDPDGNIITFAANVAD
jgi:catechol 2,3-dioxygenase-like lactoylglutathione lyase family enzyme